jgi:ribonuclease P protein component
MHAMPPSTLVTIKKRSDFLRVRGGAKWSGAGFLLDTRPALAPGPPRFGFTVTKKLGNAVARNRIRRRLKEAVRLVHGPHAWANQDYVVVARSAAADLPFERLCQDVVLALKRVHRPVDTKPRPKSTTA